MAKDLGDVIGHAVGRVARETVETISSNANKASTKASKSPLAGPKGLAAGAGLVALAPIAARGVGKIAKQRLDGVGNPIKKAGDAVGGTVANPIKKAGDAVGGKVTDAVGKKIDEAGGPSGIAKEGVKGLIPGMGGGNDKGGGKNKEASSDAIGKNRRMPIQQAVDVAVPVSTAYNQWTQFEEWPNFMHRLDRVSQEDETNVSFKAKIWGKSKEFKAEIVEQRPDERIKWKVTEGLSHTGVVTFHEIADRLTRVNVDLYVEPGSLIEKAARGMRHIKRAVRADLARFKAYIEFEEEATGEWRGAIEDSEVKSTTRSASSRQSSRSSSDSGDGSRSSSGRRTRASSSGSRKSSGSSGSRKSSGSSASRKSSGSSGSRATSGSSGSRKSSGSSRSRATSGSSGSRSKSASSSSRSGSSSSRSSSNGRSGSSSSSGRAASNGRSGSRSGRKQTAGSRS